MKCLLIAIPVLILTTSCSPPQQEHPADKSTAEQTPIIQAQSPMPDTITQSDLQSLSLNTATKKFGSPATRDTFVIDEHLPEFRIELYNYIKDYKGKHIRIVEATWPLNAEKNITAWYPEKDQDSKPVHTLVWDKNAEF